MATNPFASKKMGEWIMRERVKKMNDRARKTVKAVSRMAERTQRPPQPWRLR